MPSRAGVCHPGRHRLGRSAGTRCASLDSDGTSSAGRDVHYNADSSPTGVNIRLHRDGHATTGDPIKVPYTWSGLHAWFQVTANLQKFVGTAP